VLSNKLLHAQLDVFCRIVLKGDAIEMDAKALGLTMESNGIRILEPFDTAIKYSNASGKTNIHVSVTDIFMNFSFSILKLFLAVEEDILAFLSTSAKKMTVLCSQFDKVGTIKGPENDHVYVFWRPCAPPGFAVLGDYLTPTEKPPTKGVLAINTSFARVKKPISFKLIWPPLASEAGSMQGVNNHENSSEAGVNCSIWFPVAPEGYIPMGCVVSQGIEPPPVSSVSCILASLVTPCSLRDCITIKLNNQDAPSLAFWRLENSVGTFLPSDPTLSLMGRAYELRHMMFGLLDSPKGYYNPNTLAAHSPHTSSIDSKSSVSVSTGHYSEAVASFQLVWWNHESGSRKKFLSGVLSSPKEEYILETLRFKGMNHQTRALFSMILIVKRYSKPLKISSLWGTLRSKREWKASLFGCLKLPQDLSHWVVLPAKARQNSKTSVH
jgi:vacuolar protein sorting-associated protein 13A/C